MERIPNEIYFAAKYEEFMDICSKLEEVKDCELTKERLFNYMYEGIRTKRTFSFVSYKNDEINGCLVLSVGKNLISDLSLFVIFIWIDKKSPKLWKKYLDFVENVAKEFKVKKIIGSTKRMGFERKLEEFGYKETYRIIEKEIN
jgi:hypothetical protein